MKRVAIFGASGYAGLELTEILKGHPRAEALALVSDRLAAAEALGDARRPHYLSVETAMENLRDIDVAFLCTPADAAFVLAQRVGKQGVPVIDLSGAHRLTDPAERVAHYAPKADAASPFSLHKTREDADEYAHGVYGLPELFRADDLRPAGRPVVIANPGCYATAAALALAPAVISGLVDEERLSVTAMSGITGAGRSAREEYSFSELAEDARAYKCLRHQHTPEITMALQRLTSAPVRLAFTPHLVPLRRGILLTAHLALRKGATEAALLACYRERYAAEPFVEVLSSPDLVSLHQVVGTNRVVLGLAADGHTAVVVLALDNLVKGAAGQAVQNMNRLFGFPETEGLLNLRRFAP
jgi:N-acetyl-gamma-glutamyl-phosphate reductase